jgi:hypothetical protein
MAEPIFQELVNVRTKNELYNRWIQYLLSLTMAEIEIIVDNGLTYQADSLRSMIREILAGQPTQLSLLKKVELIYKKTYKQADMLR